MPQATLRGSPLTALVRVHMNIVKQTTQPVSLEDKRPKEKVGKLLEPLKRAE